MTAAIQLRLAAILLIGLTSIPAANADEQESKQDGIAIGEKAPDFKLTDQNGKPVELKKLLADDQPVALVFHRSADW